MRTLLRLILQASRHHSMAPTLPWRRHRGLAPPDSRVHHSMRHPVGDRALNAGADFAPPRQAPDEDAPLTMRAAAPFRRRWRATLLGLDVSPRRDPSGA